MCLSARHQQCPVFNGAPSTFPRAGGGRRSASLARFVAITAITIAVASGASVWWLMGSEAATPVAPAVATPAASAQPPPAAAAASVTPAPVVAASVTATPARALARYRVRPGDNLTSIAAYFGARMEDMIRLNGLPPDGSIQVDQELLIPQAP